MGFYLFACFSNAGTLEDLSLPWNSFFFFFLLANVVSTQGHSYECQGPITPRLTVLLVGANPYETELLTNNPFPLVPSPDVWAVLHIPHRHQASELNPFPTKRSASFPEVLAILS